ncbi:MAG: DUF4493 domain-containing protein, partial [Bacteroidaceae bacterium]|nr:DUF4493 domain-containing protein [Bacteroidaceae bacterium]
TRSGETENTGKTVQSEDYVNWTAVVSRTENSSTEQKCSTTVDKLATQSFVVGGGYSLKVYNYVDDAAAHSVNNNWGAARYEGTNDGTFAITENAATDVSVACGTAKNARMKVVFSLNNKFNDYKLTATSGTNSSRSLEFNSNTTDKCAYYSAKETVNYSLVYKYNGTVIATPITGDITIGAAATESVINIKSNTNGSISLSITYNDSFGEGNKEEITLDAVTGGVVSGN